MSNPNLSEQLQAPLALVRSIAESFASGTPPTALQLQVQLAQLQGAVGDVLDTAGAALSDLLAEVDQALEGVGRETARAELEAIVEELEDQLGTLSDLLGAATTFEDLGEAKDEVEAVDQAMQETLSRLGCFFETWAEEPTPAEVAQESRLEESGAVIDALSAALAAVDRHLVQGDLGPLQQALEEVQRAGAILQSALESGER